MEKTFEELMKEVTENMNDIEEQIAPDTDTVIGEISEVLDRRGYDLGDVDYSKVFKISWEDDGEEYVYKSSKEFEERAPKELTWSYDAGYGSQELGGFIVMKDGNWFERGEYDGSEWWEYKAKPTLNEEV
jgi:hypothetical protein